MVLVFVYKCLFCISIILFDTVDLVFSKSPELTLGFSDTDEDIYLHIWFFLQHRQWLPLVYVSLEQVLKRKVFVIFRNKA